jgi:hypothetical protein
MVYKMEIDGILDASPGLARMADLPRGFIGEQR